MSNNEDARTRVYPPDYVSLATLAYRLDCSRTTIDSYVRLKLLPKPHMIGNLQRWDFEEVKIFIAERNRAALGQAAAGPVTEEDDAYMKGLKDGAAAKG